MTAVVRRSFWANVVITILVGVLLVVVLRQQHNIDRNAEQDAALTRQAQINRKLEADTDRLTTAMDEANAKLVAAGKPPVPLPKPSMSPSDGSLISDLLPYIRAEAARFAAAFAVRPKDGEPGAPGPRGLPGPRGHNGHNGRDGVGIKTIVCRDRGKLAVTLTDSRVLEFAIPCTPPATSPPPPTPEPRPAP